MIITEKCFDELMDSLCCLIMSCLLSNSTKQMTYDDFLTTYKQNIKDYTSELLELVADRIETDFGEPIIVEAEDE